MTLRCWLFGHKFGAWELLGNKQGWYRVCRRCAHGDVAAWAASPPLEETK